MADVQELQPGMIVYYYRMSKYNSKTGPSKRKLSLKHAAMWFLWSEDGKIMEGIVVSHVDDLPMGGSPVAIASLEALGKELGFGSVEKG